MGWGRRTGWWCQIGLWWGVAKRACLGGSVFWRRAMFAGAVGCPGSGGEDDGAELGEGVVELFGAWPAGGEVEGEFAGGAGDSSGGA